MRKDGIFLEVKPVLSSCPRFRALCLGCCGLEGWSVTDVLREDFLSEAKGPGGRVGISFSESINFIFECLENSNQTSGTRRFADRGKLNW